MRDFGLTDRELFPLLDEQGDAMLRWMREHPHAPRYNWKTGERLTREGLSRIHEYEQRVKRGPEPWAHGQAPGWVGPLVERCSRQVPFYRDRGRPADFFSLPIVRREEIRRQPWAMVADDLPLDELIVYTTSGTGGTILKYPATPQLPNRYLPLMCHALAAQGIRLEGGSRVSIVIVSDQHPTVVICSLSSYLGGAGSVKVNLHPSGWNREEDAAKFIEECDAELYTGDPFSLEHLARLPIKVRPKAIMSSAMALSPALADALRTRFGCPVLDMYSMNESGPIGFRGGGDAHQILQPDLFVEILDEQGRVCAPGTIGEIVLTGGLNSYLPLLRYGTGDFGSLEFGDGHTPLLRNLHGRSVVSFRDSSGKVFNSIDVATALGHLPLSCFTLHQSADGSLAMELPPDADEPAVGQALSQLFGASHSLKIAINPSIRLQGKPVLFTSEIGRATVTASQISPSSGTPGEGRGGGN